MSDRALMPDYLRLVAVFGIVTVNVQYMAFPTSMGFPGATTQSTLDGVTITLVNGLTLLKTYGLFSFMFGVGLAFQIRSAERRGLSFGKMYRNRLIGLVIFGLFHGILFFPGDILVLYAVTGAVLYAWRDWPVQRLVRVGAVLLAIQVLIAIPFATSLPATPTEFLDLERATMTEGRWTDVTVYRAINFGIVFVILWFVQGLSALGWFCLGLAAVRSGLIDRSDHPLWVRARRFCLGPGVLLSLIGAVLWQTGAPKLGESLVIAAAPLTTFGYLGLIAVLAKPPGPVAAHILQAGGSSLSIYLGQSIALSWVFAPYGLGLWDAVSPTAAVATALAVTAVLVALLILWRHWFDLGPFEALLRRITRAGSPSNG